jgi:hypothetical protein
MQIKGSTYAIFGTHQWELVDSNQIILIIWFNHLVELIVINSVV